MAPYRLYFVGTQLIYLAHVANSFILLTANMEDVKKIARKFVSDSLAEKIAEFVSKATEQLVANVSEENGQQNLSDEDQLQNIGRQRIEKNTKTTQSDNQDHKKYVEIEKEYEKEETTSKVNEDISYAGQVIHWGKDVSDMASKEVQDQSKNFEHPEADNEQQTNDFKSKPDHEQSTQDSEQQNLDNKQPTLDYEQQNLIKTKQTPDLKKTNPHSEWQKIEYEQQDPEHKKPDREKHKPARKPKSHNQNYVMKKQRRPSVIADLQPDKPRSTTNPAIYHTILSHKALRNGDPVSKGSAKRGHRLTGFDSQEFINQTSPPAFQGVNIPKSLTTEKQRVEFDQYDNPNYPKSEFIATSGPVSLPRVPMMKPWWEKEMVR